LSVLDIKASTVRVAKSHEGLDFHELRKNTGTGLVAVGVDAKTVQDLLGRADVRTTLEIYAQACPSWAGKRGCHGRKLTPGVARPERARTQDAASDGTEARTRKEGL
jgi:hypothetical protein